jgi:hypothetical protein
MVFKGVRHSAIGKLWSDGGLRDMLVDSEVYAGCTVDQMLTGKQFNRAVRDLTIEYLMFQHTIYFWDLTVHVSCCIKLSRQFFKEIQKSIGILSK